MIVRKEIKDDNELYVYFNGKLIYKRWLDLGYGKVFDKFSYGKYTDYSITDFDLDETPEVIHVKAKLILIPTEDGGRKTGITSGYRPNHVFEYQTNGQFKYAYMGDIQTDKDDWIMPGETKEVIVRFLSRQPIDEYMDIGRKWWIHEGHRVIGDAKILKIEFPKS
ncbi:hypothetical protein NQT66_14765 [Cellulophaga baltica]|uniref:EF-Tu C-terminal domain-related protein n=1 Tax=Cellulophaga baltica TaxID=76594 RepID=UPI002147C7D0|nr:hypothetical protein [Cellulophaga baltica]MCR1026082.1 hypothetical protein [Cellulophaga baltica]